MSDDNLNDSDGIANLRKQYDELKASLTERDKKIAAFEKKERNSSLGEILKAKGLKETVANHYSGDVSEEAVTQWATDLGLLSVSENDANAEAARRAAAASGDSGSLSVDQSVTPGQRVLGDPEQILNALNTLPYAELVKLGYMPADPNQI